MQMVTRGFRKLLSFGGRDTRGQFWPYAGAVMLGVFMAVFAGMAVTMQSVFAEAAAFAETHPEAVTVQQSATRYSMQIEAGSGFAPDMTLFFVVLSVCAATAVVLLAAAVARRLHDRGLPGFLGLPPVVFLAIGLFGMSRVMATMGDAEPDLGLFMLIFVNNIVYIGSLGLLVVQLAKPGKSGTNRYGPPAA